MIDKVDSLKFDEADDHVEFIDIILDAKFPEHTIEEYDLSGCNFCGRFYSESGVAVFMVYDSEGDAKDFFPITFELEKEIINFARQYIPKEWKSNNRR